MWAVEESSAARRLQAGQARHRVTREDTRQTGHGQYTGPWGARPARARQGKACQGKARQEIVMQGMAMQDMSMQEMASQDMVMP